MSGRVLMTGNDAVGEGAVRAGCDSYFGYPITPQNELTAYMARNMPLHGRVFIQAESELAAISMVYGAAAAGKRAMTSSSSPGISLKQEGISFLAGAELPAVIVNIQRAGPGLGNIAPAQGDYFQAVKGGGHGDYRQVVLAPYSVQEMHDLTVLAFDIADRYRTPVMVLSDGRLGQMMEPLVLQEQPASEPSAKPWALTGAAGRKPNFVRSLYLVEKEMEAFNLKLQEKYNKISEVEVRSEEQHTEDCDILLVAYGTPARVSDGVIRKVREQGLRAGMLRPVTLWPFPSKRLAELAEKVKKVLVLEMSAGQMVEDVRLAVDGRVPVEFIGTLGGRTPRESDVVRRIEELLK